VRWMGSIGETEIFFIFLGDSISGCACDSFLILYTTGVLPGADSMCSSRVCSSFRGRETEGERERGIFIAVLGTK
jgi:hypothetical protein